VTPAVLARLPASPVRAKGRHGQWRDRGSHPALGRRPPGRCVRRRVAARAL